MRHAVFVRHAFFTLASEVPQADDGRRPSTQWRRPPERRARQTPFLSAEKMGETRG